MKKYLKVQFSNGDIFAIPARIIAEDRAKYYAKIDGYDFESNEWEAEVQYALDNEFEIKDWAGNNMNWPDLESYAKLIDEDRKIFDYNDNWGEVELKLSDNNESKNS